MITGLGVVWMGKSATWSQPAFLTDIIKDTWGIEVFRTSSLWLAVEKYGPSLINTSMIVVLLIIFIVIYIILSESSQWTQDVVTHMIYRTSILWGQISLSKVCQLLAQMTITSNAGGGGDVRDSKRRNGIQKVIKIGSQSGPAQLVKHPVKPIERAAITEKDNGRMNGGNVYKHFWMPTRLAWKQNHKTSEHSIHCSLSEKISKESE